MEQQIIQFLLSLVQNYPWFSVVILVLGTARAVFKPAIALLDAYVLSTPATADDDWEREFKSGKVFWFLDYILSIKIPEKQK